jgi:hypothetical protein
MIYSEEQAFSIAIKWCRLAAWQGRVPEAQYDLARMYYYGQGVTRDVTQSRKWMLQAAEAANVDAMYGMGVFCTDPVHAYAWFKLAASRKSADAAKAARELRASMTGVQVEQATTLMAHLRTTIHRPSKRTVKPKLGTNRYVGSQEVVGSVSECQVEYSVQRCGDDRWILYLRGEEGFAGRDGPMYADALVDALEARGLDTQEFCSQLLGSHQPTLRRLAQEIQSALEERDAALVRGTRGHPRPRRPAAAQHTGCGLRDGDRVTDAPAGADAACATGARAGHTGRLAVGDREEHADRSGAGDRGLGGARDHRDGPESEDCGMSALPTSFENDEEINENPDPAEMQRLIDQMKADGTMPSLESFLQVMGMVREEWHKGTFDQAAEAESDSAPRRPN